ncbi:MAG: nucleotidyltransferase domain-containing protein [Nanoarchaeota archaeon]|nr:nucleotidyltransferase domain-containing protein [Nanoarchaeota archaeon]
MGNETKAILKELIEHKNEKFSIRKLSQIRKINYKSAYAAVDKLEKAGAIKVERLGNITLCSFSGKISPMVFEAEYERRGNLLKSRKFGVISNMLNEIKEPTIALVFGSYAKGKAAKGSDIDILLVAENKHILSGLPEEFHISAFSFKEFISMAKSREFSVVSEALKNNIIIAGIEDYYRLTE